MIHLPNTTLICVATRDHGASVEALRYSTRGIKFGAVKLVSDYEPENLYGFIDYEPVERMSDIEQWNKYIFYNLNNHVDTDMCLLVHADGFVVNPQLFDPAFLEFDYIGAPWFPAEGHYLTPDGERIRVGNSVSFRSKKLLELPSKLRLPWIPNPDGHYNEDTLICILHRKTFLEHGCKYAPLDLACRFSFENEIPENKGITTFAFHKHHNPSHPNWGYPKF